MTDGLVQLTDFNHGRQFAVPASYIVGVYEQENSPNHTVIRLGNGDTTSVRESVERIVELVDEARISAGLRVMLPGLETLVNRIEKELGKRDG